MTKIHVDFLLSTAPIVATKASQREEAGLLVAEKALRIPSQNATRSVEFKLFPKIETALRLFKGVLLL